MIKTNSDTMVGTSKRPLTIDEREQRDLTRLEEVYGTQAERDAAAHEAAVKAQAVQRREANRQEYIGSELMAKYLPQYQAATGTGGMGISRTDAAAAFNAYLGRVSDNNAAYAGHVAELDAQKAERDSQREAERREKEFDIRDAYDEERMVAAEKESIDVLKLIDGRARGFVGDDEKISRSDYDRIVDYYTQQEGRLTEAGKRNAADILDAYRELIRDEREQAAVDRMGFIEGVGQIRKAPSKFEAGRNFEISGADGRVHRVQIAGEVTDPDIRAEAAKAGPGEVFGLDGRLFASHQGKVYEVEARTNSYKDEFASLYDLYYGDARNTGSGQQEGTVAVPARRSGNGVG